MICPGRGLRRSKRKRRDGAKLRTGCRAIDGRGGQPIVIVIVVGVGVEAEAYIGSPSASSPLSNLGHIRVGSGLRRMVAWRIHVGTDIAVLDHYGSCISIRIGISISMTVSAPRFLMCGSAVRSKKNGRRTTS